MTAEATIALAAEAGFEGVDLLVRDVVDSGADAAELRRRMDDLGLRGGGWTLPMNWKNEPAAFEADLERLPLYAETAATLGLFRTGTWVRFESDPVGLDSLDDEEQRRRMVERTTAWQAERLGRMATVLAEHGTRIGLEIIGSRAERTGRGVPLIATYSELLRAFADLPRAHANIGVLADAYHLYAAGESAEAALAWGVDAITWVHVADPANPDRASMRDVERLLPGESPVGICRSLLETLAGRGYDGPVTAEPLTESRSFPSADPLERAGMTREALRGVWPSPRTTG
nr:sugar phosphate isomerase/epimerase family protein [Paludisphaera mucosa]